MLDEEAEDDEGDLEESKEVPPQPMISTFQS